MSNPPKAIIIGAGVASLGTAIRLASNGFSVEVFEKNDYVGGKLSHFNIGEYQFDAGPSLFTQPENLEELFALAKKPIDKYFSYQELPLSFKYFYEDGTILNAFTNTEAFAKELDDKLGGGGIELIQYLNKSCKTYQDIGEIFLNFSLHKFSTLLNAPIAKALKAVGYKDIFQTMHQVNQYYFKEPRLVQLFNRFATYNGSNPYKAPGMLTLIPYLELSQGTYYPKGGMISITKALYQLSKDIGVVFYLNSPVDEIIVDKQKAIGIVSNQKKYYSNLVVTNMDACLSYKYLLKDTKKANKVLKQERSSSALIFYWGIKKTFPKLSLHNILFSEDYKSEFQSLFDSKTFYPDPTVYINITSKCEPGIQAPLDRENWFVMVNVPANVGQDWEKLKILYRKAIIEKINRILKTEIEPLIEVESILDPILIEEKTASHMGSLYGTSSNSKMAGFLRHPNFSKKYKGLYFAGGSVHPGGGIPLCLKSAKITSQIILEDFKRI